MTPARDDARRAEIAKIHIARAQLGLDDDTYRAMLYGVTARVYSAAELTAAERRAVLDHLRARDAVEPRGEGAALALVLEGRQLAREHLEALVAHLLGVVAREAVGARVALEQRGVELEELLPCLAVGRVPDAMEERAARRRHGRSIFGPQQLSSSSRAACAGL